MAIIFSTHGHMKVYIYLLNGDNMRQILFTLSPDIQTRPAIRNGEAWQVYLDYNTDLQVFELMLVK